MRQLIRYGLVGVASNLAMYLIYLFITYLAVEPKTAMTSVYLIGASVGFVGNRKWTFAHRGNAVNSALRYVAAHLSGYLLNLIILVVFVDRLGYPHQAVQAVAIIVVAMFLFILFKHFVFLDNEGAPK